jgi:hypothetical protein
VCVWEEGGEAGDGDVFGEEVSDAAFGVGVGVPDVGFGFELGFVLERILNGWGKGSTMEIIKTFGTVMLQSWYTTSMALSTTTFSVCSSNGEALTRAAPARRVVKVVNLIFEE